MKLSRRALILGCTMSAASVGSELARSRRVEERIPRHKTYFGDLHNHNAVGYAQGSLRRTFEIARNHLDFFAFTPHGYWPDIGHYENSIENKWIIGFEVTRAHWPEVIETAREFDEPGKFVAIVGYEWHSTNHGDRHILFPDFDAEYRRIDDLRELQRFAKNRGAILIPHHPANRLGHRGADITQRDPEVEPVLEIFSEWGNAEHDRAPYPYVRHTEGGRWTRNTLQHFLREGHRFGVIASSDDHLGYPGGYREGLAAIKASSLTRESIFEALRSRRTYALSGDRIELDFRLNGQTMGQELAHTQNREIEITASGWDQIDRVELLKNNRVIHRNFPMDRTPTVRSWNRPVLIRFEYGWGPWPALSMTRVADWKIHFRLQDAVLEAVHPCFLSGPLEEDRRDRILEQDQHHLRLESFTALRQQIEDVSQKAIVLKVRGGPEARLTISVESPGKVALTQSFRELAESGEMLFTGEFPRESAMVHRLVFADHYETSFSLLDRDEGKSAHGYYVRVIQANGQLAWSSPIWVAARQENR